MKHMGGVLQKPFKDQVNARYNLPKNHIQRYTTFWSLAGKAEFLAGTTNSILANPFTAGFPNTFCPLIARKTKSYVFLLLFYGIFLLLLARQFKT